MNPLQSEADPQGLHRIFLELCCNKIPIYPIFYLLKGDYSDVAARKGILKAAHSVVGFAAASLPGAGDSQTKSINNNTK